MKSQTDQDDATTTTSRTIPTPIYTFFYRPDLLVNTPNWMKLAMKIRLAVR